MDWLTTLYAHREVIAACIAAAYTAWIPFASFLAEYIPRPVPSPGWRNAAKRGLYDLIVDTPATRAALGRIGIFGGRWNLPGIPSRLHVDNPPKIPAVVDVVMPPPLPPPPPVRQAGVAMRAALATLVIATCLGTTSCAPGSAYVIGQHIEQGASASLDAAYATWRAADKAAQLTILDEATSTADYKTKITIYRGIQTEVDAAFTTARDAVKVLSEALGASGATTKTDFAAAEAKALAAVTDLADLLAKYGFKITLPPPPSSWRSQPARMVEVARAS